jgi:hypothetical protein
MKFNGLIGEVGKWLQLYIHRRLHSTPGYFSPKSFEKANAYEIRGLATKTEMPHN